MNGKLTFVLRDPQQAHKVLEYAWRSHVKPMTMAGNSLVCTIGPEKRSGAQNDRLHATLADVAMQVEWAGARRDVETWKRLMVAAWCRASGEPVTILPALDGNGVDLVPRRTRELSRRECAELIDYIHAWGAEHDVVFHDVREGDYA